MKKIITTFLILPLFLGISGCNQENSSSVEEKATITWKNWDGQNLEVDSDVIFGSTPSYDGDTPNRDGDAQYTYTFTGWSPSVDIVTGDATYIAQFSSSVNHYTITWNVDGNITTEDYEYGTTPSFKGDTSKPKDAQYTYTFTGWSPIIVPVSGDATYVAQYSSSLNSYTITWNVDGKITTEDYEYGTAPSFKGDTSKPKDAQYTYTFTGWSPSVDIVTGDATYVAQYSNNVNHYEVTWKNYDGEVLTSELYEYGSVPLYKGTTPTKPSDTNHYLFDGWNEEIVSVREDQIYTAKFELAYTITWKNYDGAFLAEDIVKRNTLPIYQGDVPTKEHDTYSFYTFAGWSPSLASVKEDATYFATFNANDIFEFTAGTNSYSISNIKYKDSFDISIPSIYRGFPVTSIGSYAFQNCSSLTSLIIPDSVTSIGDYAFQNCSSLTSLIIPDSVNTIGKAIFDGCTSLQSFSFPYVMNNYFTEQFGGNSLISLKKLVVTSGAIPLMAFKDCTNLTSIEICDGVTSIGQYAFENCSSLTSIVIPDSVTSIDAGTFSRCVKLTSITIGDFVNSIGNYVFSSCSSLTSIVIPDSVTSIGDYAFLGCKNLQTIKLSNSLTKIGNNAFRGCSSLTSIVIPDSVTSIGSDVFYNCKNLQTIKLSNSLTKIGNNAFSDCSSLASIVIPDSVKSIGDYAFQNCLSLPSITIPDGVTSIGSYAFQNCLNFVAIIIPDSVTSIGSYAFYGCKNLQTVKLSNSLKSIGESAFGDCSSLTSMIIPDGVTSIGDYAFQNCSSLTSVTIPNSVTTVGKAILDGCTSLQSFTSPFLTSSIANIFDSNGKNIPASLKEITITGGEITSTIKNESPFVSFDSVIIKDGVTSIGAYAFNNCVNLTSIVIPDSVTYIGSHAFYGCKNLQTVKLSNSLTKISDNTFYNCNSLTSIVIPDSVIEIGDYAFSDCDSLASVTLGNSVKKIGISSFDDCRNLTSINIPDSVETISYYAFSYCYKLVSVDISNNSKAFLSKGAFHGCSSLTSIVIPYIDYVTGKGQLADCKSLQTIIFLHYNTGYPRILDLFSYDGTGTYPKSLKNIAFINGKIPSRVISGCSSLTSVVIENGVTSIGLGAFSDCSSLTSITIPDSVTSIEEGAFSGCSSLASITIPDSVTSIEEGAFSGCSSLTSIVVDENNDIFDSRDNCNAIILTESNELLFGSSSTIIPDSVTSIGEGAFSGRSGLTLVVIPDSVTSIGTRAFEYCNSLTSITIPDSVTSIEEGAFSGCLSLTSVIIPDSVTFIDAEAFDYKVIFFYEGSIAQWQSGSLNHNLDQVYFYSETMPIDDINAWHYVDGVPTIWEK